MEQMNRYRWLASEIADEYNMNYYPEHAEQRFKDIGKPNYKAPQPMNVLNILDMVIDDEKLRHGRDLASTIEKAADIVRNVEMGK